MRIDFLKKLLIFALMSVLFSGAIIFCLADSSDPYYQEFLSYGVYETTYGQCIISQNVAAQKEFPVFYRMAIAYTAARQLPATEKIRISDAPVHVSEQNDYPFSSVDGLYTVQSLINACLVGNADNAAEILSKAISENTAVDTVHFLNTFFEDNGMSSTYFVPGSSFSTIADMAKFVNLALENDIFRSTFCSAYVAGPDGDIITNSNELVLENTSDILGGIFSVDTSVFVRISGGTGMIAVVKGSDSENCTDVQTRLLSEVTEKYSKQLLVAKNSVVASIPVNIFGARQLDYKTAESIYVYMPANGESVLRGTAFKYEPGCSPEDLTLPIKKGQLTGYVTYLLDDGTQITLPLYAASEIHFQNTFFDHVRTAFISYKEIFIIISVLIFFMIVGVFIKFWEKH